jgi:hypothetical protein
MDARPKTVTEILQTGTDQYLIPFFQRHYKWTKKEWERLWLDSVRLLEFPDKDRHFLGSMVCTPHCHVPGEPNAYQLIDGQQRITTLTILLTALKNKAGELEMDQLVEQIHEGFLVHKWEKGTRHYRVVPRTGDREVLFGVIDGKPPKTTGTNRIKNALRYFRQATDEFLATQDDQQTALRNLFSLVTSRLSMVVITIDDENPYEIFWSLNGKGLPLRQSDLIRNFVFMQVPLEEQEEFNRSHWDRLENLLGETDSGASTIDATRFYRNFLMRNGVYIRKENTFLEFQNQYGLHNATPTSITDELIRFAEIFRRVLDPAAGEDDQLTTTLSRLRRLDQATCHPLVMNLIARCGAGETSPESVLACLNDLQSFILRRSICSESTRGYGRLFVEAITKLESDPEANLKEFFLAKQWPDDAAFVPSLVSFDLYRRERKMAALVLTTLEKSYGSKEAVDLGKGITIEHVMPQTITSGTDAASWQDALGPDWNDQHKKHIDTIGNLTLTGYNSELSNSSFEKKRTLFNEGNLLLNRYFKDLPVWDSEAIEARGQQLALKVAATWPRPAGKPYVPAQVVSPKEKLLLAEFWSQFLDLRSETHPDQKRPRRLARNHLSFRSARSRVWYYAEVYPDDGMAHVGVFCRGYGGNEFIAALWEDIPDSLLEELDERLKTQYYLYEPEADDNDFSLIYLEKSELSFARPDWSDTQTWLLQALAVLREKLEPFVLEVDPDTYEWDDDDAEADEDDPEGE